MRFVLSPEALATARAWGDLFDGGQHEGIIDVHCTAEHVAASPKVSMSYEGTEKKAGSSAAGRLADPDAVISRSDLRELGFERRAIDAIFRSCPVVSLPGYSRPLIRVADFQAFLERHTYQGDRVRPCPPAGAVL
jgi:hypothetical protein